MSKTYVLPCAYILRHHHVSVPTHATLRLLQQILVVTVHICICICMEHPSGTN